MQAGSGLVEIGELLSARRFFPHWSPQPARARVRFLEFFRPTSAIRTRGGLEQLARPVTRFIFSAEILRPPHP
jgi:hypothetical protein